jgi:ubiquinone/menaquinone biosynthesis C-methylase UbiE
MTRLSQRPKIVRPARRRRGGATEKSSVSRLWELSDSDAKKLAAMRQQRLRPSEAVRLLILHPSHAREVLSIALVSGWRGATSSNAISSLIDGLRVRRAVPGAAWSVDWAKTDSFVEALGPSLTNAAHALELGCGDGRISRSVAPHVANLVCTDVSRTMVDEAAKNLAVHDNVRCEKVDGFVLSAFPDESFDIVFAQGVLTYMDPGPLLGLLDEVKRVLRPSGTCVFNFATLDNEASAQYLMEAARTDARRRRVSPAHERPYAEAQIHAMYRTAGLEVLSSPLREPGERLVVVGRRPT